MQEQSVHQVSTQPGENINAINGITKALPYTKEMKTQPTGSSKSA